MFQSPRNRVNTSNEYQRKLRETPEYSFNPLEIGSTLQIWTGSPVPSPRHLRFQSPRNRVNTSNFVSAARASSASARRCFNPLEIGSTLQIHYRRPGAKIAGYGGFQSPRNRVNTSNAGATDAPALAWLWKVSIP